MIIQIITYAMIRLVIQRTIKLKNTRDNTGDDDITDDKVTIKMIVEVTS